MRRLSLSILFFITLSINLFGQKDSYFKRVFVDAEYYLLYEEYRDALPLYLEIQRSYPENANIQYRIGQCYLNIPTEKNKSIPYLQKAITKINDKYREGYFTETKAPKEAFLLYGRALRIVGDFDKALQAFIEYKNAINSNDMKDFLVVDKEIESIEVAKSMIANPKKVTFKSLGRIINSNFSEINPVSNSNGSILIYTSLQRFYNAILYSEYKDSAWSVPTNLNPQIFADGPISTVGMSGDGGSLVLSRNDNDDFNLYISKFDQSKKVWSQQEKLPKEINGRSWETYGSLSMTGDTLYFSSNREGGFGGFDLYISVKMLGDLWSNPVNLGSEINTPMDESAPFIADGGKKLFFCSKGHNTMGGYDIFVSKRIDGIWKSPENLGYPLNTTDDDLFFFPIGDGLKGFISRTTTDNQSEDIYLVTIDL
ncbi:MAG: PD40 domain-containing protein [Bacteroidales bacterium]|nr:PD40 domain-containing protein [Bacteroidales bacterium]